MKWTSVLDEFPEEECLAINDCDDMLMGWIVKSEKGFFVCESEHEILKEVTHWIPQSELLKLNRV